jgi:hypothetical protein
MLDKFRHWSRVSDAKIDRTAAKVEFYAEQRAAILDAHKCSVIGQRLLRATRKSSSWLTARSTSCRTKQPAPLARFRSSTACSPKRCSPDIDIENSANAEKARKKFAEFGIKTGRGCREAVRSAAA